MTNLRIFLAVLILLNYLPLVFADPDKKAGVAKEVGLKEGNPGDVLENFYSISDINKNKFSYGTYQTEGYVIQKYDCPPCPENAMCKPCMGARIVISEAAKEIAQDGQLTEKDLIVFVEDTALVELGKKYRFLLQVLDVKTTQQPVNNVKLIYFEALEGL